MEQVSKFIFDVDGTLTPSRGIIDYNFKAFFNTFCLMNDVYLVTGSDKAKTVEQISEPTYNLCKRVYQCSGSDVWEGSKNIKSDAWKPTMPVKAWLEDKLEESSFPLRTGLHIEERQGMVNFSIVGRNASLYERKQYVDYDAKHNERNYIAELFNREFPNLQATVGGETGIDIAPCGADKSQILRDFNESDSIHFYGDAMFYGGNDEPLARALEKYQLGFSHQVKDWKDTWNILKECK